MNQMILHHGVTSAAVVGLGTMGCGIAQLLAMHGIATQGFDSRLPESTRTSLTGIDGILLSNSLDAAIAGADIVFEAVSEDLTVKKPLLRRISELTSAVIASNTSTFLPSVLADFTAGPERFLAVHFFYPADVVPLVEIVPHPTTSLDLVERMRQLLGELGKSPVVLRQERKGFVANRLQAAILREALALIEEGVVTPQSLDRVVKDGLAPRWAVAGLIGAADLGGLDIFTAVCSQLFPELSNSTSPGRVLTDLQVAGHLGAKSGTGFYEHTTASAQGAAAQIARLFTILTQEELRFEPDRAFDGGARP